MSRPKTARLTRIRLYPLKSFDGVDVSQASLNALGGLVGDREYRLKDGLDRILNGKRLGESIIKFRALFQDGGRSVSFVSEEDNQFHLPDDLNELGFWFSQRFGEPIHIERNQQTGFPDDEIASGPTIVSKATLVEVATWFEWDLEDTRRRFRANLEVDGVPAFWEDGLFGEKGEERIVKIGGARLEAMQPCARCAVPSRNSYSGRVDDPSFAKTFAEQRRKTLPKWVRASRFNHFYRLCVNTRVPAAQTTRDIAVGDAVELAQ